jgi:phosphoglycerol transferase MdoB-like AlkP superfamily enzyme
MDLGIANITPQTVTPASAAPSTISTSYLADARSWIRSARYLPTWFFPASLAFYLKWFLMVDQQGFAREARSMGLHSLNLYQTLSFFRGEILVGVILIPLALLTICVFLRPRWAAFVTAAISLLASLVLGVQILSLKELGRFSSAEMLRVALSWGWHEPGSNVRYLMSLQALTLLVSVAGIVAAAVWSVRLAGRTASPGTASRLKTAAEIVLFVAIASLLLSAKSDLLASRYQQNSYRRAFASLWSQDAIENADDTSMNMNRDSGLASADLSNLSERDLIARYRALTNAPEPDRKPRYFGKESGANILFFILETTPEKYLPAGTDMKEFPNFNRLQDDSFVGTRHYTTFPITRCALFSLFSSWYPIDDPNNAFDSPSWDTTGGFLRRLNASGYKTAVFSPLRAPGIPDAALYDAVGFSRQVYPDSALTSYDNSPSWQQERVTADLDSLQLLESQMDAWMKRGDHFAVAFLPQIAHSPYPDNQTGTSAEDMQRRGQAILVQEDAWLGQLMDLVKKDGQLDNTIVVVLGDHGLRSLSENPDIRRGTIDETAFHVPLIIHAPRALNHTEEIPWLTSHIDVVPTLLDLLGVKNDRESEQGSEIWNPALAKRTTFFFAKPMFGADGYTANGEFYMWHYFSDTIYAKSSAQFDPTDIVPRRSPTAANVTSDIENIVGLEKAWHRKFSLPVNDSSTKSASAASKR